MGKAEDRALTAYPIKIAERDGYDENLRERKGFVKGYHQAEKDLELTWKDFALIHLAIDAIEANINLGRLKISKMTKEYYQEVLKRFNKERKEK